jgi:hypothetical protein
MEKMIQPSKTRVKNACEDMDKLSRDTNSRLGSGSVINLTSVAHYNHRAGTYILSECLSEI